MIAIVDYNAGNLTSVARALASIGETCEITAAPETIVAAGRVIFPGVGAAGSATASLKQAGLDEALRQVMAKGTPLLGICLGTQIILEKSRENDATCLGLIKGEVLPFDLDMTDPNGSPDGQRLKIPHMGWNTINIKQDHPFLTGTRPEDRFYFVHSYYPAPKNADSVIAVTDYGVKFASVIGFDNLIATQFHPEKSGPAGLRLLKNFCGWKPC